MRHVIGVLGVVAALVLLAVSGYLNWSFGFSLGRTQMDGYVYGAASAAADCFKALIPFFVFAAIRSKAWLKAAVGTGVGIVMTAYSLTSALGHASLNRMDVAAKREIASNQYQDVRADLKRYQDKIAWVPKHRPVGTVEADLSSMRTERFWATSAGCTNILGPGHRESCQRYNTLVGELGAATEAAAINKRIAELQAKLETVEPASTAADPQAGIISVLIAGIFGETNVKHVQMGLAVFVAVMLELGSAFGLYVACSVWEMKGLHKVRVPVPQPKHEAKAPLPEAKAPEAEEVKEVAPKVEAPRLKLVASPQLKAALEKKREVRRQTSAKDFAAEMLVVSDGSIVNAVAVYDAYEEWCSIRGVEPMGVAEFTAEVVGLGFTQAKLSGRTRYIGVDIRKVPLLKAA